MLIHGDMHDERVDGVIISTIHYHRATGSTYLY